MSSSDRVSVRFTATQMEKIRTLLKQGSFYTQSEVIRIAVTLGLQELEKRNIR